MTEQIFPQAPEIEMAVLGSCMLDENATVRVRAIIKGTNYFYKKANQKIFGAIQKLNDEDLPIDLITVAEKLKKHRVLKEIGGEYYLTQCIDEVVSVENVEEHARIVVQKAIKRGIITIARETLEKAYEDTDDPMVVISDNEHAMIKLSNANIENQILPMGDFLDDAIDSFEKKFNEQRNNQGRMAGIPFGLPMIDKLTGGWMGHDVIIAAAVTGAGKTAMAMHNAYYLTRKYPYHIPVGIFSLEMSKEELIARLISIETKIPYRDIRRGLYSEKKIADIMKAQGSLKKIPIYIDDSPLMDTSELVIKSQQMVDRHGVKFIIIDFLQLLQSKGRFESYEREIAHICQQVKYIAKKLEIPILLISQLNRVPFSRKDKRPLYSDLKGSGAIEQTASIVAMLHRPDIYDPDGEDKDGNPYKHPNLDGFVLVNFIFAKFRDGECGVKTCYLDAPNNIFYELDEVKKLEENIVDENINF